MGHFLQGILAVSPHLKKTDPGQLYPLDPQNTLVLPEIIFFGTLPGPFFIVYICIELH